MRIYKFDIAVTAACLSLLGFFAWHAYDGPRGFDYRDRLKLQSEGLETDLAAITEKRTYLAHRVVLLRPESIDPDMLDEQARQSLDVAKQNELIARQQ